MQHYDSSLKQSNMAQSRTARQSAIRQVLDSQSITSQAQLQHCLATLGIKVTQATLSRDLFELRATKVRGENGISTYVLTHPESEELINGPENRGENRLRRWCQDLLVTATYNNNFVLLRTPAGAAQLLASTIDNCFRSEVLGSIAGDDTIMIMCRDDQAAQDFAKELLDYAE